MGNPKPGITTYVQQNMRSRRLHKPEEEVKSLLPPHFGNLAVEGINAE
jgi:hypothetical protein